MLTYARVNLRLKPNCMFYGGKSVLIRLVENVWVDFQTGLATEKTERVEIKC